MATVRCRDCGQPVDESSNTPFDERQACPACGSRSRSFFVEVADHALAWDDAGIVRVTIDASDSTTDTAPTAHPDVGARREHPRDTVTVADHTYTVTHTQTPGGAWITQVYDERGRLLDLAAQNDVTDALLAVIESLIPPPRSSG